MIQEIYIFGLLLCLLGILTNKNSKILGLLVIGIIVFLLGRGALTLDTYNYLARYIDVAVTNYSETYEKGYLLLMKIAIFFGFNYIEFRLITVFLSFFLISNTVNRYSSNRLYVYLFYFSFCLFIDAVQIRNFIAFSIVIFSVRFLIDSDKKHSTIKYCIGILVAGSIHISALIYLCLLLLNFKNKEKLIKIIFGFTLIFCVFIFLNGNKIALVNQVFDSIGDARVEGYSKNTKLGFLYAFTLHFLNLGMVYFARKIYKSRSREYELENKKINVGKVIEIIFWINVVSIVFFPLFMSNLQFIRLSRNYMIINLIAFSLVQLPFRKINMKIIIFNSALILNIFAWYYFTFIIQEHVEDIIVPFFEDITIIPNFL